MRAGIGLIALLMGVGLMFYLMSSSAEVNIAAKKQAETQINQIGGRTSQGRPVTDTVKVESTPKGAKVLSVETDSPLVTQLGLKAGDVVVEIGPFAPDQFADDATARAFLSDAVARNMPLVVQRDGSRVTLPQASPPAQGGATPVEPRNNPQRQAQDLLKKVQTH